MRRLRLRELLDSKPHATLDTVLHVNKRQIHNRLLYSLPAEELEWLWPRLRPASFSEKTTLYEQGERIKQVYFPETAVISLFGLTKDGASVEVANIGNEGVAGLPLFFGIDSSPGRAVTEFPGNTFQMRAEDFKAASHREPLKALLLRYTHALLMQTFQSAICNRFHSVEQRCARWLLNHQDRAMAHEFPFTHEFLAEMLGATRSTVSEAVEHLERERLIESSRGKIRIINRKGLQSIACECYGVVREEFERFLSSPTR